LNLLHFLDVDNILNIYDMAIAIFLELSAKIQEIIYEYSLFSIFFETYNHKFCILGHNSGQAYWPRYVVKRQHQVLFSLYKEI